MKRLFISILLINFTISNFAQIQIGNYRYNEQKNWNSNVYKDVQLIKDNMAKVHSMQELYINVNVLMNAQTTSYAAVFQIRQLSKTAFEANTQIMERVNGLIGKCKSARFGNSSIIIDHISQVPIYGLEKSKKLFNKTMNEIPIGFEIQKNIIIPFTEYNSLNKLVTMASSYQIYDLIKVDHFSSPAQQNFDSMRVKATEYISKLTKSYAKMGVRLDTMRPLFAENTRIIHPISRYKSYTSLSKVAYDKLLPENSTVYIESSSAKSLYYNPLSTKEFQIIVNPNILVPSVQYTLQLQLKFFNYAAQAKLVKETYLINKQGEVRLVNRFSK